MMVKAMDDVARMAESPRAAPTTWANPPRAVPNEEAIPSAPSPLDFESTHRKYLDLG